MTDSLSPYERFGGHEFFTALVRDFYVGVAQDPVLRPMYPDEDLGPAEERLRMFLEQYWGGPTTYSDLRGHPRLRMRHSPYSIAGSPICGQPSRPGTWQPTTKLSCGATSPARPWPW